MKHVPKQVRDSHNWKRGKTVAGQHEDGAWWERWPECCTACGAGIVWQLERESNLSGIISTDPEKLEYCKGEKR